MNGVGGWGVGVSGRLGVEDLICVGEMVGCTEVGGWKVGCEWLRGRLG